MLSAQQFKDRLLGIGGSDMAIILGLSSYKTPYQLYLEKIGESKPEIEPETEPQYWGNQLESIIRDEFSKRNKVEVIQIDTIIHPEHKFLRGNLDGFIPSLNSVLEIKNVNAFMTSQWGEEGTDNIPLPYLVQVAFYCMLKEADYAHIAVLIGGNKFRQYLYERDLDLENKMIKEAKIFWNCVQNRTPPNPANIDDLKIKHPEHRPEKKVIINKPIAEQLTNLTETRFKIKELSDVEEKHKFNIMQFMGDAESLVNELGQPIVSWKANKRGSRTFLMKGV